MGYIFGTSEEVRHEPSNLFLHNCKFRSDVLKVAASAVAKDGYVLERDADGKLKVASAITAGRDYFVLASRDELYGEREFAVRVCVCGMVKKSLYASTMGWATRTAETKDRWHPITQGTTVDVNNTSGTGQIGFNWSNNYTVAPKAHVKLWYESGDLKCDISYPNGTYSSNYSAKSNLTLNKPTGTARIGIIDITGDSNKGGTLENIKVYKMAE